MELLEPYHIKKYLVKIVFLLAVLLSVSGCSKSAFIPRTTGYMIVTPGDSRLKERGGMMYYDSLVFTGKVIGLFQNGDTASVREYDKGLQNGIERIYHQNGKISEVRNYIDGRKEGEHKGWWENGSQKFIYHFKDDLFEGSVKMWNEKGMLFGDYNYVKGHEEGTQKAWFPDGTLQANYVVKNNRKYGLTGVKNCKTVTDEKK